MYSASARPTLLVPQPSKKEPKKQVLFLTPTSSTPYAPLPLTPVPPTPRPSPTESDVSLPSSSSSRSSYESSCPSTPPIPIVESEYYAPEPPQPVLTQVPSIHYILSQPSFDLSLPLPTLLSQIPPEHLNQAATFPPISSLFITSQWIPWYVHITPGAIAYSPQTPMHTAVLPATPAVTLTRPPPPAYSYSTSSPAVDSSVFPADDDEYFTPPDAVEAFVTIHDILTAFHSSLHSNIKPAEFQSLSEAARDCVSRSYHSRIASLDERAQRKTKKKGALRKDVLPLGYTRVVGFYVGNWDPDKREAVWGVEFGLAN